LPPARRRVSRGRHRAMGRHDPRPAGRRRRLRVFQTRRARTGPRLRATADGRAVIEFPNLTRGTGGIFFKTETNKLSFLSFLLFKRSSRDSPLGEVHYLLLRPVSV